MAGAAFVLRMIAALDTAPFMAGMKMMGATAGTTGSTLNTALGAGAIAVAGTMFKSAQAAIEWEDAYAGVKRTIDTSDMSLQQAQDTFDGLEDNLREIGTQIPITHQEIASMAQIAGALGVPTDSIDEFTKTAATLSKLSDDLSAEDSAFMMGKIRTVFGIDPDDLDNFASSVVALGVKGASTEKEILSMAQMAGGAMSLFGAGPEDVLAFSSAFANVGVQAEAGGSAIQKMFLNAGMAVSEGNKHLTQFAKLAGVSEEEFGEMFREDAAATVLRVVQGLAAMEDPLEGLRSVGINQARWTRGWGSVISAEKQARDVTGELSESFVTANEEMASGQLIQDQAATRFDTTKASIDMLLFAFHDLAITIGDSLLPPIKFVADAFIPLVGGFNDLLQSVPALTAVLGPLLAVLSSIIAIRFGAKLLTLLLPMGPMGAILANSWTGVINTGMLTPIMTAIKGIGARVAAAMGLSLGGSAVTGAAASAGATAATAYVGAAGAAGFLGRMGMLLARMTPLIIPVTIALSLKEPLDQMIIAEFGRNSPAGKATGEAMNDFLEKSQTKPFKPIFEWPWESGGFFHQNDPQQQEEIRRELLKHTTPDPTTMKSVADKIGDGFKKIMGMVPKPEGGWDDAEMRRMMEEVDGGVEEAGAEVVRTIMTVAGEIETAWGVMSEKVKPPKMMSAEDRIQQGWEGIKQARKGLGKAVRKDDPVAAAFWLNRVTTLRQSIRRFKQGAGPIIESAGQKFHDMKTHTSTWTKAIPPLVTEMNTGVQTEMTTTTNIVQTAMDTIKTAMTGQNFFTSGIHMVSTFAAGITAGTPALITAATTAAAAVAEKLKFSHPPRSGPLSTIRSWGPHMIDEWVKPMRRRLGRVSTMSDRMATAITPRPRMPALAFAGAGRVGLARPGPTIVYKIGTLVADENGIDELDRRMERRRRRRARARRLYNETD